MLERAIALAATAHEGQVDKDGSIYILHPLRVMLACSTPETRLAGVLHDVVEDTSLTLDDLRPFGEKIMAAVAALTRQEGESYEAFIERLALDPIAREVKIADLRDNLGRMQRLDEATRARLEPRYRAALARLGADEPAALPLQG